MSSRTQARVETIMIFPEKITLLKLDNTKSSVGPETSIPEIENLKAQLPFPREDFSFPRSDSCQIEHSKILKISFKK